ncbi:MAG: AbrB/MazE/SpoVT family DNA-binding domain-containing protein [Aurantimonas endophytica]|uniref:antitoxin n=1 Tax=Aurantimonas endophytica TaxID=1522175 RepID=UPI003002689C
MATRQEMEKEASVFRDGASQAIRIPEEFEIASDRVMVSRQADGSLLLRPTHRLMSLVETLDWLKEQGPLDDFPGDPGDEGMLALDDVKL